MVGFGGAYRVRNRKQSLPRGQSLAFYRDLEPQAPPGEDGRADGRDRTQGHVVDAIEDRNPRQALAPQGRAGRGRIEQFEVEVHAAVDDHTTDAKQLALRGLALGNFARGEEKHDVFIE